MSKERELLKAIDRNGRINGESLPANLADALQEVLSQPELTEQENIFKTKDRWIIMEEKANLTFGDALVALKKGKQVARSGWNGKKMYLTMILGGNDTYHGYAVQDCIGMKTANALMQPGWLASQNDMLAEDWTILNQAAVD